MKIIFVGINNKPNKEPLCRSTKSGKLIYRIVAQLPNNSEFLRTNLYDVDYFISDENEKHRFALDWHDRINPYLQLMAILNANQIKALSRLLQVKRIVLI